MASYNRVILCGNLTRDPQVKYTAGGTAVAEVGLAVNRTWFDKTANQKKEECTFVDVTFWGRTAEVCGEFLTKGKQILVEGRLQLDQWEDKDTGQKRSKLKVVGEQMTMLGSGKGNADQSPPAGGYDGEQSQVPPTEHRDGFSPDAAGVPESSEVPF